MMGEVQGECNHSLIQQIFIDCLLHARHMAWRTECGGLVLRELTLPWEKLALRNESLCPVLLSDGQITIRNDHRVRDPG